MHSIARQKLQFHPDGKISTAIVFWCLTDCNSYHLSGHLVNRYELAGIEPQPFCTHFFRPKFQSETEGALHQLCIGQPPAAKIFCILQIPMLMQPRRQRAIYGHYHGDSSQIRRYSRISANNGHLSHFCQTHMPFQIFRALAGYPTDIWPSLAMPAVNNTDSHWIHRRMFVQAYVKRNIKWFGLRLKSQL